MSNFKVVTKTDNNKSIINLDFVRQIEPSIGINSATIIYFHDGKTLSIQDKFEEFLLVVEKTSENVYVSQLLLEENVPQRLHEKIKELQSLKEEYEDDEITKPRKRRLKLNE